MNRLKIGILFLFAVNFSCTENDDTYQKLEQVEALSYDFNYSSAQKLLNEIDIENINTDRLSAFYNLLKAEIQYRCEGIQRNDSLINISINYYQNSNDKERLAAAYYIRALLFLADNNASVLEDLKNAESLIDKIENIKLKKRIYTGLTAYYGDCDEFPLSLKYARKEYECAKKIRDKKTTAYTLLNLSVNYDRTGNKDSAKWCILECEKLIDQLEPNYLAYLYYGLGSVYSESDIKMAEEYLKKSIELGALPQSYKLLSDVYMRDGKMQMAKDLWAKVMQMPWDEFKIGVLDAKLEYDYQNHNFEEYRNTQRAKSEATKRYYETRLQNKADELSRKYDIDLYSHKVRSRIINMVLITFLVVAILIFIHFIRVRRIAGEKVELELNYEKSKSRLALMEKRIADLESDKKSKTTELAILKNKSEKLKERLQNNLLHGHDLYDRLEQHESPINWTNDDLLCLFDFVATVNPDFILSLDSDYNGLNAQQKLFLIADDFLKKNDYELCNMFNLGKDSLRNKRYRIKQKTVTAL